jgi:hypothetical protein
MDSRRVNRPRDQKQELGLVKQQVDLARRFFNSAGQRYAQTQFLRGVLIGFLPILAVASVLGTFFWIIGSGETAGPRLVAWALAGAVGAALSNLIRIKNDDLKLNWEASRGELLAAGAIRPVIGAFLGAAIPMLFIGGLAAITTELKDSADVKSQFTYLSLALVAGFSERWAPDLLARQPAVLGASPADRAPTIPAGTGVAQPS